MNYMSAESKTTINPLSFRNFIEKHSDEIFLEVLNNPEKSWEEVARYCYDSYVEAYWDMNK